MEILASLIALYLIVKFGWPVLKFLGIVVVLAMVMQSCGAHAGVGTAQTMEIR